MGGAPPVGLHPRLRIGSSAWSRGESGLWVALDDFQYLGRTGRLGALRPGCSRIHSRRTRGKSCPQPQGQRYPNPGFQTIDGWKLNHLAPHLPGLIRRSLLQSAIKQKRPRGNSSGPFCVQVVLLAPVSSVRDRKLPDLQPSRAFRPTIAPQGFLPDLQSAQLLLCLPDSHPHSTHTMDFIG
jgi:hypothetical protein